VSEREDDLRLEHELREVLHGRDPGTAPYGLSARVDRVPEEYPAATPSAVARLAPLFGIAAAIAVAATALSAFRWVAPAASVAPGASVVPAASFDPFLEGPGVVTSTPDLSGFWALVSLAVILLLIFAVTYRGAHRRSAVVVAIAIAVVLGVGLPSGVYAVTATAQVSEGGLYAPGLNLQPVEMPPGYSGRPMAYVVAGPREPYSIGMMLWNHGPLPVTVHGVVTHNPEAWEGQYWAAMWLDGAPGGGSTGAAVPLSDLVLAPGEYATVWLVGRASICALGPSFDPNGVNDHAVSGYTSANATLSVSVLGWPVQQDIELPADLHEPVGERGADACLATTASPNPSR
jgi:hypothetical protein